MPSTRAANGTLVSAPTIVGGCLCVCVRLRCRFRDFECTGEEETQSRAWKESIRNRNDVIIRLKEGMGVSGRLSTESEGSRQDIIRVMLSEE